MKIFWIALIFISKISIGQTVPGGFPGAASNWKTLNKGNYSIQYPPEWDLDQSGQGGSAFFISTHLESATDKFKENINLLTQDLTGRAFDLDKYVTLSMDEMKRMLPGAVLVESKRVNNGNAEHHKMIYTANQGGFQLKFEQYYWVINNKAYVLTFTAEKNKFEKFKVTGEKIMNTFMFSK